MSNESSEKRSVDFDDYDKFRFKTINDIRTIKEQLLEQKIELLEKLHEQSVSATKLEGVLNTFTESVKSIQYSMETINHKIDVVNEDFKENDNRVRNMEEQLKQVVGKKESRSDKDDDDLVVNSKAKWWSGFFVFLGIAIPAIIEKVDVILDFILKLRG